MFHKELSLADQKKRRITLLMMFPNTASIQSTQDQSTQYLPFQLAILLDVLFTSLRLGGKGKTKIFGGFQSFAQFHLSRFPKKDWGKWVARNPFHLHP